MAAELGGAAVSAVASKAAESAFDSIGQHMSYMFKYQSHLDDLKKQVQDLKNARHMVEHRVGQAKQQGEEIEKDVEQWLNRVNEFTEGVVKPITGDEDKAKKRCFIGLCPNLIQRYMLGKKAVKAFPGGAYLLGKGNFSRVSYRPPIQRTESVYIRGYEAFDSRRPVLQEIMEALKDANVNMVGVYGMAGVGKTTLVKKVASQAKEEKLFDEVVMTTVTQIPDFKKIQEEIADQLGLTFLEQSVSGRSLRLRDRLKREKRILVILDDLWAKLDLDAVGIPYGDIHEGIGQEKEFWKDRKDDERRYKILLTSRDQHVLSNHMNIKKNFLVDLLSDEEAWCLFQKIVGDSVETSDFQRIAVEVVRKCARLPIAIETLAKALKGKSLPVWEDALGQLTRSNPRQIEGMVESVCSVIELSYNFLKSEGKSLFLLCALNNVGQNIHIADLLKYSMGLCLFRDVYTFEAGRSRLLTLIDNLKASSLLLDGITKDTVKMHDIIHAVAISIASSDEFLMFNIKNVGDLKDVLEEKIPKTATAITLPYGDVGDELPQSLEYPKLKLFHLFSQNHSLQIPDLLFQGMKELQVLDLTGIRLLPLPSSLRSLKNLKTLCLDSCRLEDIAIVGELKKLKILSLISSRIKKLPREIGQLTRLKMLDLSNCSNLIVIPPNVISSLTRLEELYMGNSFRHWEIEGVINNQEQKNASVLELKQLSYLTTLEIRVHDLQIIPQELFSEKLKRYRILIGDVWGRSRYATYGETLRMLKIKLNNSISLIRRVKVLLKKTEELHLELNGIKNSIDELDEDGFAQLKHLRVQNGHELLYILNIVPNKSVFPKLESLFLHNLSKLKKICDGKLYAESFSKLRILKVEKCDMLEHLFSFSEYKKFSKLQEIEVIDCKNLKQIFGEGSIDLVVENERNSMFEFTQLRSLVLQCLPQFIKFGMKVVFPTLENLKLSSIKIEDIWLDQQQPMSSSFQCLKSLIVEECNGLNFLFSSFMVKSFMQLQKLVICNCKSMKAVILDSEGLEVQDTIIDMSFPKLFFLNLVGLPKLTRFGTGNSIEFPTLIELHIESCSNLKTFFPNSSGVDITNVNPLFDKKVAFHNLETLIVERCKNMKSLFLVSIATGLLQLKKLRIYSCGLEEIVANEKVDGAPRFLFPQLTSLDLRHLRELKHFYLGRHTVECPKLKSLSVSHCEKINLLASEFSKVQNTDQESQPFLVLSEKVMPNLESMDLGADAFKLQTKGPLEGFCKLKNLWLDGLNDESIPFFYGFLKRSYNLENLTLWGYSLKELFPYEIDTWKEDSQMHPFLPNLKTLNVDFCLNLTHLLPSSTPFTNLTTLYVMFCNGLVNIFTCSIVKSLVQLTKITIEACSSLKEVIIGEFDQTEDEIVFCQLKTLNLRYLPSLTCFCSTTCAFKFSCLEQVIAIGCPKLKTFTQGSLSTPKLNRVQRSIEMNGEYVWKGDLNSTIQQMFIEMPPEASSSGTGVSSRRRYKPKRYLHRRH